MSTTQMFGIPNCDTIKKAKSWLNEQGIEYAFIDFKKTPPTEQQLRDWIDQVGWELLLNRRGMMWRKVPQETKDTIDEASAIGLMLETPSIIKRPVLLHNGSVTVGFKPETYAALFCK